MQTRLRLPEQLPLEDDVALVRNYSITQIKALVPSSASWTAKDYTGVRDAVVCRLTMFNARRGGEPARLLLSEWEAGENGVWIDKHRVQQLPETEQNLFSAMKVTNSFFYQGHIYLPHCADLFYSH